MGEDDLVAAYREMELSLDLPQILAALACRKCSLFTSGAEPRGTLNEPTNSFDELNSRDAVARIFRRRLTILSASSRSRIAVDCPFASDKSRGDVSLAGTVRWATAESEAPRNQLGHRG